jgi:Flp pilus assembly pilin Flp
MKTINEIWREFIRDEKAAEVTELGVVLAMLVAGAVAAITLIGPKVTKYYQDVNEQL